MEDLIKQLRDVGRPWQDDTAALCDEAADEITRLRAELESMTKEEQKWQILAQERGEIVRKLEGELGRVVEENDRLRTKLESMTKERDEWMAKASRVPEATGAYAFVIEQGQKAGHRLGHLMKQPGYALEIERLITLAKNEAYKEMAKMCKEFYEEDAKTNFDYGITNANHCADAILALVKEA